MLTRSTEKRVTESQLRLCLGLALVLAGIGDEAEGGALQVSGGLDARYEYESVADSHEASLDGAFLNLRQVWSDDAGDRWIGVAQVDFDHNFEDISPYQVYLQYKGPLGRWNIRAGHYLLPFGLLATYDTERLLLQGIEEESVGLRKDTGAEVLGFVGDWDYAVSVSDGLGDSHLWDSRASPVLAGRIARVSDEWQIGLSTLLGHVLQDRESGGAGETTEEYLAAIDATVFRGPATIRTELTGGAKDGEGVLGGVLLADYALMPKLEVNTRYAMWDENGLQQSAGLGLTARVLPWCYLRIADEYEFEEDENVFTAQIYMEFSHAL